MPEFSTPPYVDFSGVPPSEGARPEFLSPPGLLEQFAQSFTGTDFKITAVIPYEHDIQLEKSDGLAYSAARLEQSLRNDALSANQRASIQGQLDTVNRARNSVPKRQNQAFYKTFAEIQTLSITTRRSVSPVRRLGEATPAHYTRGPRTIAGSAMFIFLQEDVLLDIFRKTRIDSYDGEPAFVMDRLPPFNILITGANEFGHQIEGALFGVTLLASGVTLSIDDLFTEQQFTWVARWMLPMARRSRVREILNTVGRAVSPFGFGAVSDLHTPNDPNNQGVGRQKRQF